MRPLRDTALLALLRLRPSEWQKTLAFAALIGVTGALATIGFRGAVLLAEHLLFGRQDGLVRIAEGLAWWQRLAMPAAGGAVAGLLLMWARRLGAQKPAGDYMEAISLGSGDLPVRVSLVRALSSAATVATGGAIGREGPMVQLAALTGSLLGRWRRSPIPRRRLLVACGAAAGVATAYSAPIAGALFVAEIVLQSVAIESLGPLLVAAVMANLTQTALVGFSPAYRMPGFVLPHGTSTLLLAGLGLVAGFAAPAYLWLLDRAHGAFGRWPAALWLKLGAGGLIVGALSIAKPEVWGNGYSVVNSILQGNWPWTVLIAVLVFKLLAVAATTGSGAVGGIFTPTLFVGAVAGALFGAGVQQLWPGLLPVPASVAVGMGAFLAACTHAPLMSVLMIFEMTENYGVVVPLMLACVVGYFISRALRPESIYSAVRALLPAPSLAIAADFLRRDSATVRAGQSLRELEEVFLRYRWQHVYVLDDEGSFLGAISLYDLAPLLREGHGEAGWPAQLLRTDYPRVSSVTPSWQVLETFAAHPGERLPVLDGRGRLLGHVTKTDVVLMFRERLGN
ncbi:ClcB-like voltage-gated chloride channel protein [Caenimonas terrae]|uniref:ClcB-like voltage-gated chloride channel protein n=1 Tax=Caenimonas terrae TaxID=696074 RepID=A0ABW0NCR8_9BURK